MKTLRDYEQLIRDEVKKISGEDINWDFSVEEVSDNVVTIRWTYLDYCEEKNNCFFLTLSDYDEEYNESFMTSRTPKNTMIEGYSCTDNETFHSWQMSYENAIELAIHDIAYYASSRY